MKRQTAGSDGQRFPRPQTIAIVGGAYAGLSALVHLRERFADRLRDGTLQVVLCDRDPVPGPGLAWSEGMTSDRQLTNLAVGGLRLSDGFRPRFADWLRASYPETFAFMPALEAAYPPRRYFGEYLKAMAASLARQPGVEIRSGVEVEAIAPRSGGGYVLTLGGGDGCLRADRVIVCTGAAAPAAARFSAIADAPGFIADPWPAPKLRERLRGAGRIAILGTGLTAVDIVKELSTHSSDVHLVMTSRRGRFNAVTRDLCRPEIAGQPAYQRTVLTDARVAALPPRISLAEFRRLIRLEIESAVPEGVDWERLLAPDVDGVAELRERVADHELGRKCRWQMAIAAIDEVLPLLWQRLGNAGRRRWLSGVDRAVYQNYSNPMPHESATEILDRIDRGRITVLGGLLGVDGSAAGLRLRFRDRTEDVTHAVNCTGIGVDVAGSRDPLMRQMLADGLVRPHRFGGVELEPDSLRARKGLYFVGLNATGVRHLTSGCGFVREMVSAVVNDLAAGLFRLRLRVAM